MTSLSPLLLPTGFPSHSSTSHRSGTARCFRVLVSVRCQGLTGDDDLLHLGGAFVDPERPDLAVESLYRMAGDHAEPAENLYRIVDYLLCGLGGVQLGHRGFSANPLGDAVLGPGGAVNEESARIDA